MSPTVFKTTKAARNIQCVKTGFDRRKVQMMITVGTNNTPSKMVRLLEKNDIHFVRLL